MQIPGHKEYLQSQHTVQKKAFCTSSHYFFHHFWSLFYWNFFIISPGCTTPQALHNTTFLSDYSIFYCFLFLNRISLILSTSSTMPALTTVWSFSKTYAHLFVLHTYSHTSDIFTILTQVPLLQNTKKKSSKDISSLLTYLTHLLIYLILYSKIKSRFSLRRGRKMNHYFYQVTVDLKKWSFWEKSLRQLNWRISHW